MVLLHVAWRLALCEKSQRLFFVLDLLFQIENRCNQLNHLKICDSHTIRKHATFSSFFVVTLLAFDQVIIH